ncbi:MAG: hypothetical protein K6357_07470 [Elusimicrobiota bacterium]
MKENLNKLLKIDRRWLFLLLTLSILIPIIKPIGITSKSISTSVQSVYDFIEKIPENSTIILSLDYDPSTAPELHPQAAAILKHAFKKNIKVIILTFLAGSGGLIDELTRTIPPKFGKEYGKDYVLLPYMPNIAAVLTQMSSDIYAIYDKDVNNKPLRDFEMMKNIKNYKDISCIIDITGTAILDYWVVYVGDKYGVPILGGVTAISQVGYGPYLQKKQIKGLIGGMKGSAEYERLISEPWKGTSGIDALNIAHLLVITFIIFSNIVLLTLKFTKE